MKTVIKSARAVVVASVLVALGSIASPALAGQCPAGREGNNPLGDRATQPKGVADRVIGSVDLGNEIGVAGRDLRLRQLVIRPGGIVPFHSHDGRPAVIVTVRGEILEYSNSCLVPIVHKAGDVVSETNSVSHYWVNRGKAPVVLLAADVKGRE